MDGDRIHFIEVGGLCTRALYVCPIDFAPTGNEDNGSSLATPAMALLRKSLSMLPTAIQHVLVIAIPM